MGLESEPPATQPVSETVGAAGAGGWADEGVCAHDDVA